MIWEWKCHAIVMLTEVQEREQVRGAPGPPSPPAPPAPPAPGQGLACRQRGARSHLLRREQGRGREFLPRPPSPSPVPHPHRNCLWLLFSAYILSTLPFPVCLKYSFDHSLLERKVYAFTFFSGQKDIGIDRAA